MANSPKISIVTACLNDGSYLEDAVLSVLQQNYPNFEHIVVDGGSQDGTLALLKRYPHLRWISEPDQGQSDALNKGFYMARGDLVGWLNADEYYMPGALEAIARTATESPAVDFFYGDCLFVDPEGRLQRAKTAHDFDYRMLLYYGCFIITATTFFRRNLIREGFLLDTNYRVVMDFEYFVRSAAAGKQFQYIDRLLGAFRWRENNVSLQHVRRRMERLRTQHSWSALNAPDQVYDMLAKFYQGKRAVMKVLNGAYPKEWRILREATRDTAWFRSEEGLDTCQRLLLTSYSGAGGRTAHE